MRGLLTAVLAVSVLSAAAQADYIDLPVKWSQPPDLDGDGEWSDHTGSGTGAVLPVWADDFVCDSPDPIVAVRWWGHYWGAVDVRPDNFTTFDISFHFSQWAHPRSQAVQGPIVLFGVIPTQEVFTGAYSRLGHPVYRYDAYLPEPLQQWLLAHVTAPEQGYNEGELFIDICKPSGEMWAWQRADGRYGPDFAAYSTSGHAGGFTSSDWSGHPGWDMAFELMVPEPATMALVGLGLVGLVARRRRKRR